MLCCHGGLSLRWGWPTSNELGQVGVGGGWGGRGGGNTFVGGPSVHISVKSESMKVKNTHFLKMSVLSFV